MAHLYEHPYWNSLVAPNSWYISVRTGVACPSTNSDLVLPGSSTIMDQVPQVLSRVKYDVLKQDQNVLILDFSYRVCSCGNRFRPRQWLETHEQIKMNCLLFRHRRRLGAEFGGTENILGTNYFWLTFVRRKFPFQRQEFLMTFFSHRPCFVSFFLVFTVLNLIYNIYGTFSWRKTPISEQKISSRHLFKTHFVLSHALNNSTSRNIGATAAWAIPTSNFWGQSPHSPLSRRPCVSS